MTHSCTALVLVVSFLLTSEVLTHPHLWLDHIHSDTTQLPEAPPSCQQHPDKGFGKHPDVVEDKEVTYTLTYGAQLVTKELCRGRSYILNMAAPETRFAMVTIFPAVITDPAPDDDCKGRVIIDRSTGFEDMQKQFLVVFTVPCNTTAKTLQIKSTSAHSKHDSFHFATATFTIDPSCISEECLPHSPTVPLPSSPLPTPSPSSPFECPPGTATWGPAPCTPSPSGYDCFTDSPKMLFYGMKLHWQLGGCPPINPCTSQYQRMNPGLQLTQTSLHMMVEMPSTGYIALGFATNPDIMLKADAVIGWVSNDGSQVVNSYPLGEYHVAAESAYKGGDQWLSHAAVVSNGTYSSLCFSRPLSHPGAKFSPILNAARPLKVNYARGDVKKLYFHSLEGGFGLNLQTGDVHQGDEGGGALDGVIKAHGALMVLAWALLVPLGVVIARRKEIFAGKELGSLDVWFQLHRAFQGTAVLLFCIGILIAFVRLSADVPDSLRQWHKALGILLLLLVVAQVVAVFVRPRKEHPTRAVWFRMHQMLGIGSASLGLVNVFIGIEMYHRKSGNGYAGWVVPVVLFAGGALVADVVVGMRGARRAGQGRYEQVMENEMASTGLVAAGSTTVKVTRVQDPVFV